MNTSRFVIWVSAIVVGGVLLLLDAFKVYPRWLLIGPVLLGVAGVALLADQITCAPARKGGFSAALVMIALSAGTVTQDAGLVVDTWSIWPFLVGAAALSVPFEVSAAHRRRAGAPKRPTFRSAA